MLPQTQREQRVIGEDDRKVASTVLAVVDDHLHRSRLANAHAHVEEFKHSVTVLHVHVFLVRAAASSQLQRNRGGRPGAVSVE